MNRVANEIIQTHQTSRSNLLLCNQLVQLRSEHRLLVVDTIGDHQPAHARTGVVNTLPSQVVWRQANNIPISLLLLIGIGLDELDGNDLHNRLATILVVGNGLDRALGQSNRAHRSKQTDREGGKESGAVEEGGM
jgi:hypothetical protein